MLYASSNYAFGDFSSTTQTTSQSKAYSSTYFMPNEHDKLISQLRTWISTKAGGGVKWGKSTILAGLPSRLPPEKLFDVMDSHTNHCTVCMTALKNSYKVRNVAIAAALLALSCLRSTTLKVVVGAVFGGIAFITQKLIGLFHKYEFSHQNNN
jgi:hypothetical protein